MADIKNVIEKSFIDYAGAVIQSRALTDIRDILKPSARQIFYSMYTNKLIHSKPYKKTNSAIGRAMDEGYIHGDSSCEGIILRASQPFAFRYPLVEVKGNSGTLIESGNWSASRYCLTGETLVSTDKGLIKIEDIVKSEENSDNEIPTFTCRGAFGLTTTNLIFNSGLQQTYKLTLKNGIQISGTPNHPILTLNDKFEFVWKTIDELDVGDKILLNVRNNFLYGEENDIEYAKALGCLISEGYLSIENKIDMINSDLDMIMPVQNLLQKYGSKAIYHKRNQKDNCYQISTSNQALYKRLKEDNCTYNSYHKHIPNSVFRGTREYQKEFIRYLFEGDGCISIHSNRYGTIAYSSVSEDLIRELQILLLSNFGIVSFITRQKKRKEIKLEIGGEDAYLFCKNIGFVSDRKNEKAEQTIKFYEENRNKKSTGSKGWRVFPEIRDYLMNYHPEAKLIISRKDRPNECKGPLMSKDGLKILKERLPYEVYSKIEFIYRNFVSIPIIQKEDNGLQVVYSPKINEGCNSFTANGIINHNTSSRLSEIGTRMFESIEKDTILEWRDNFDETGKIPSALPSKGFPNICNGTAGIGIGLSSSIPQFNLKEVVNALKVLIKNPDASFEEIYCTPDFATGALLYNEDEVKEALKNGQGGSCKLRSVIDWDPNDRCFVVSEIPYSVYTNTICGQLEEIIQSEENPGIERFNDLTGTYPLIKIYLEKRANPDRVLKYLYKNTSLQYHYSINMTALKDGRYPKVFTWKELLQAHIVHQIDVYTKGFQFDLAKIQKRIHILNGLIICKANIEEVIKIIKNSNSPKVALEKLQQAFILDEEQSNAVLKMRLSQLTKLEVNKLEKEREDLTEKANKIELILSTPELLEKEIIKGWEQFSSEFGDARRTRVVQLSGESEEDIEVKNILFSLTNFNRYYATETSSILPQRRKGVGSKMKLKKGEFITHTIIGKTNDKLLLFSVNGEYSSLPMSSLHLDTEDYLDTKEDIAAALLISKDNEDQYLIFATSFGYVKKSKISLYQTKRNGWLKALKLEENDVIKRVEIFNNEKLGLLSSSGYLTIIETSNINPIGKDTRGIIGIKLSKEETLLTAHKIMPSTKEILTIAKNGDGKRTSIKEFRTLGRGTKGVIAQKGDLASFCPITSKEDILITSNETQIRLKLKDIPLTSRATKGVSLISLKENQTIKNLIQI